MQQDEMIDDYTARTSTQTYSKKEQLKTTYMQLRDGNGDLSNQYNKQQTTTKLHEHIYIYIAIQKKFLEIYCTWLSRRMF